MSLTTWKEEFYPVAADEVAKEEALAHSLKKWQGLTAENLKKHDVFHSCRTIRSRDNEYDMFFIHSDTCALCQHYAAKEESCRNCPLTKLLYPNGEWEDEPCGDHYALFISRKNPTPMIELLTKAFEQEQQSAQAGQAQDDQTTQEFGHEVVNPNIKDIIKERNEDQ